MAVKRTWFVHWLIAMMIAVPTGYLVDELGWLDGIGWGWRLLLGFLLGAGARWFVDHVAERNRITKGVD